MNKALAMPLESGLHGRACVFSLLFLLIHPAVWASGDDGTGSVVSVKVLGVDQEVGQLVACLWGANTGFPVCGDGELMRVKGDAVNGGSLHFRGLPPGRYAVTVFHDLDSNGDIARNFFGLPREPVGVSGSSTSMGRPSYKTALFSVADSASIQVTLRQPGALRK